VGHWVIDPKLLGLSAWMLTTTVLIQPPTMSKFPWRWVVPFAWSIMLAAGFFAPSWAFGNWMPPRTIAGVYIIFVLGWFTTLWLWLPVIRPRFGKAPLAIGPIGIIIFSLTMVLTGTAFSVMHDFASRIRPWHRATENRYALLRKSPNGDALIPPLPKPPWNLLDGEIVNDPGDYRNWSTVSFFHLRSVRLIPARGSPPPPPDKPTRPPAKGMGS
jgi:4-amino-4-deoxy-L-arabinose transferase-like glycosyltransferase